MTALFSMRHLLSFVAGQALFASFIACGGGAGETDRGGGGEATTSASTTTTTTSTTNGTGGSTGGAGGEAPGGSDKPVCANPGAPTGPTPEPRADTAGTLAADGRTFVIFGGDTDIPICGSTAGHTHVGDTWVLDAGCGTWTKLDLPVSPGTRSRHSMALDAPRHRALLFGGRTRAGASGPYTLFNDVWAFDFMSSTWALVTTTGAPPSARANAAIAVVGDKLVVFGGSTSTSGLTFTPKNDTWVLDLTTNTWVNPAPAAPPKARLFHAMAADPSANRVYVHAGGDANAFVGPFFKDLFALDLDTNTFTNLGATNGGDGDGRIKLGLSARKGPSGTALYAFGGHDDGTLGNRNDVLSVDLSAPMPAWSPVQKGDVFNAPSTGQCKFPVDFTTEDMASPERRSAFAFAARQDGEAFLIFGGDSDCGRLSDAWWFDATTGAWTPIRKTLPGLTCLRTGSTTCTSMCG